GTTGPGNRRNVWLRQDRSRRPAVRLTAQFAEVQIVQMRGVAWLPIVPRNLYRPLNVPDAHFESFHCGNGAISMTMQFLDGFFGSDAAVNVHSRLAGLASLAPISGVNPKNIKRAKN